MLTVPADSGADDGDGVEITIEPKDGLTPGFYTIVGRLIQIGG
ncbi:MAG: hypothetical protein O3B84_03430 [Chloroflexi bacterium]|nr:hypothetical protein [Chloroflexota bacterium]